MFMQLMYLNANQFDTNLTLPPSMSYFQIMHIVRKSIYFSVMSWKYNNQHVVIVLLLLNQ